MMPPVDYDFYANVFLGRELEPVRFPRLAARAEEFVEELCRGKCGSVPEQDRDLLRFAVCAVVEVLLNEERMEQRVFSGENNIVSESVGGYSVSYGNRALELRLTVFSNIFQTANCNTPKAGLETYFSLCCRRLGIEMQQLSHFSQEKLCRWREHLILLPNKKQFCFQCRRQGTEAQHTLFADIHQLFKGQYISYSFPCQDAAIEGQVNGSFYIQPIHFFAKEFRNILSDRKSVV